MKKKIVFLFLGVALLIALSAVFIISNKEKETTELYLYPTYGYVCLDEIDQLLSVPLVYRNGTDQSDEEFFAGFTSLRLITDNGEVIYPKEFEINTSKKKAIENSKYSITNLNFVISETEFNFEDEQCVKRVEIENEANETVTLLELDVGDFILKKQASDTEDLGVTTTMFFQRIALPLLKKYQILVSNENEMEYKLLEFNAGALFTAGPYDTDVVLPAKVQGEFVVTTIITNISEEKESDMLRAVFLRPELVFEDADGNRIKKIPDNLSVFYYGLTDAESIGKMVEARKESNDNSR